MGGKFQFHIGAIISKALGLTEGTTNLFQFHIGAIISNTGGTQPITNSSVFQFHIGAIIRSE